jgi:hypothetical protein
MDLQKYIDLETFLVSLGVSIGVFYIMTDLDIILRRKKNNVYSI